MFPLLCCHLPHIARVATSAPEKAVTPGVGPAKRRRSNLRVSIKTLDLLVEELALGLGY
jgi:hypothetical protein